MPDAFEFRDMDDFFASLGDEEVTKNNIDLQRHTRNELLGITQTSLHFVCNQSADYPSGLTSFESKYRQLVEQAVSDFKKRFFPLKQKRINILFEAPAPDFGAAARNFTFNDASWKETSDGKESFISVFGTDFEDLKIYGDRSDAQVIRDVVHHELGHIGFGISLPNDETVQELPSCFVAEQISQKNGSNTGSFTNPHDFNAPKILAGKQGWGLPAFAKMNTAFSVPMYTAWLHGWRDVFGSDNAIEEGLMHSLKSAETRSTFTGSDAREYRQQPSLNEWLKEMELIIPGIQQRFLGSSVFGNQMPEGERVIWTPHKKWGGVIDIIEYTKNQNFNQPWIGLDLQSGIASQVSDEVQVKIPDLNIHCTSGHNGRAKIDPLAITDMVTQFKGTSSGIIKGTKIIVSSTRGGTASEIELVWNENAESMIASH